MEWFVAVVAVAALGVAAVAAAGGMGQMSKETVLDTYRQQLPDRPLNAAEVHQARFGVTLRGYAMNQVDDLIERLAREIEARDARIAELMGLSQPTGSSLAGVIPADSVPADSVQADGAQAEATPTGPGPVYRGPVDLVPTDESTAGSRPATPSRLKDRS